MKIIDVDNNKEIQHLHKQLDAFENSNNPYDEIIRIAVENINK